MPALAKPHRIAVLVPDVALAGPDAAYEREAAALVWIACIELCQRHARLAVLDADATPLVPRDGHFAPEHAQRGASLTDAFYAPTRRDELIWLEVGAAVTRVHARARGGGEQTFEAPELAQAIAAWAAARGAGPGTHAPDAATFDDVAAVVRAIGPALVEAARGSQRAARPLVARLPRALRVPALRLLELALRADLSDEILAVDPDHPQARFAGLGDARDADALRAIIAAAPGWARPYEALAAIATDRDACAAAGMAAVCRPAPRAAPASSAAPPGDVAAGELARDFDALVASGREADAPFAYAQRAAALRGAARIAAVPALVAAGDHRRALEALWAAELTEPAGDAVAIAHAALAMTATPIDVVEAALGERIAIGATTLARRMARTVADFVPAAAKSEVVARALGKATPIEIDRAAFADLPCDPRMRRAIDAAFDELGALRRGAPSGFDIADERARGDRLVERWLDIAIAAAPDGARVPVAQVAAYTAAQALARYLAATTHAPTTLAGALRTVAAEALALVRATGRDIPGVLGDREARALAGALDPLLRRVDRWVGTAWLAAVERGAGIDERSAGDVAGFVVEHPTIATRILGPEETAVLAWSVARRHRERPKGWATELSAEAQRLALHTGTAGIAAWADAVAAQLAAGELALDDALDALHTASYLGDGATAVPRVHAARALFDAGRAPAALAVMLHAIGPVDVQALREPWTRAAVEVPFDVEKALTAAEVALAAGEAARADALARWAIVVEPDDAAARRVLGLALAQQGKLADALAYLAPAPLADALEQRGAAADAQAVRRFATGAPADAGKPADGSWRARRLALAASRARPAAWSAALAVLADTSGAMDREALLARHVALAIRAHTFFARAAAAPFEAPTAAPAASPAVFADRVVIAGGKVERISDYVALLRDLAALAPREALAQFDLDAGDYLDVARAWAAALRADPTLADAIAAALAR